jgi:hypothetical protein
MALEPARTMLGIIGVSLTVIGIILTALVAVRQNGQVKGQSKLLDQIAKIAGDTNIIAGDTKTIVGDTQKIAKDTHKITQKLDRDTSTEEMVTQLFCLRKDRPELFTCLYPVRYFQGLLPLTMAGDFYALQVLQGLLHDDRLRIKGIAIDQFGKAVSPSDLAMETDIIYLCTPQTNPELCKMAPDISIKDRTASPKPRFGSVELPCWFGNRLIDEQNNLSSKVIWTPEWILDSPSEDEYKAARELNPFVRHEPKISNPVDYGIVLRITEQSHKHIVIAGIHQYGTWITAEWIKRLASIPEFGDRDILPMDDDFLAVIVGHFDSTYLRVLDCHIFSELFWIRQEDSWTRQPIGHKREKATMA